MQYPYIRIEHSYRPILPIVLQLGESEVDMEALVDSGSDRNIFDAEYASILGIEDISEEGIETPIIGVTGEEKMGS